VSAETATSEAEVLDVREQGVSGGSPSHMLDNRPSSWPLATGRPAPTGGEIGCRATHAALVAITIAIGFTPR
jgi:hypothetical protein